MKYSTTNFAKAITQQSRTFLPHSFARSGVLFFLLGISLVISTALIFEGLQLQQKNQEINTQLTRLQKPVTSTTQKEKNIELKFSGQEIGLLNRAIVALNIPWHDVFNALEEATPAQIALINLQPKPAEQKITLLAEAAQPYAMLDYVRALKKSSFFTDAYLLRHEINQQDPYAPYRFELVASWKPLTQQAASLTQPNTAANNLPPNTGGNR